MKRYFVLFLGLFLTIAVLCQSDNIEERIKKLEETLVNQSNLIEQQRKTIEQLKEEIELLKSTRMEQKTDSKSESKEVKLKSTGLFGSSSLMNPNISVVVDTSAYTSNLDKEELEHRYLPGFTPSPHHHEEFAIEHGHAEEGGGYKKGFHFNYAELYLYAPVDPYFNLYTTIPFSEEGSEVEEAYFVTSSLPNGFQLKGGKFKSGFGRLNSQHAHMWDFYEAPLPYTAFLGGEGLTDTGFSINYLPRLPFYLNIGGEVFQGNNEMLFGKEAKNGPHCYTIFAKTSFDFGNFSTILTGISFLKGDAYNKSIEHGSAFRGDSSLYDFEFTYKWKKSKYRGFTLQTEYLYRTQKGNLEEGDTINYFKRTQDGLYLQAIYLFGNGRWRIGTRYERLNLLKDEYKINYTNIYFGKDPYRISTMVEYNPTEFSRIRFQHNYDKSCRLQKTNNEFILQFIFGIGAHAAHSF